MAATSGHVSVTITDRYRVQYRHRRPDSEARKNRFLFRIFTRIAFHSEPRHGRQHTRVSIDTVDYCTTVICIFSITKLCQLNFTSARCTTFHATFHRFYVVMI